MRIYASYYRWTYSEEQVATQPGLGGRAQRLRDGSDSSAKNSIHAVRKSRFVDYDASALYGSSPALVRTCGRFFFKKVLTDDMSVESAVYEHPPCSLELRLAMHSKYSLL
jgi:hypothetical protein